MVNELPSNSKYPPFIYNLFKNSDVHIVGSGPSLIGFDYSQLENKRVITINHSYKLVKSEFTVFVDKSFYKEDPEIYGAVTLSRADTRPAPSIGFNLSNTFSFDPLNGVYPHQRKNSGASALCIALQGGAKKIYLYGFDYRFFNSVQAEIVAEYNGGSFDPTRKHWAHSTSGRFNHTREDNEESFKTVLKSFNAFPTDNIINMSPFSALERFRKVSVPDNYQRIILEHF